MDFELKFNSKILNLTKTESSKICSVVLNWFRSVRAKIIRISGVVLQENI